MTGAAQRLGAFGLCAHTRSHAQGFEFDLAYTSVLKRAIKTLWLTLEATDQMWVPVIRDYRLNERHYGALAGLDKAETTAKHGEAQVRTRGSTVSWRPCGVASPPVASCARLRCGAAALPPHHRTWTTTMSLASPTTAATRTCPATSCPRQRA